MFTFLLLLSSCDKVDELSGDDVPGYSPILLSAQQVSPFTRAYVPTGMYDNFKVYAAWDRDGTRTVAMDGYEVRFADDSWTYDNGTQPLAYWNGTADYYLFTAGAPINAVTAIGAASMTLHIENNTEGSAMASEPQKIANNSDDFGKTVNLRFGYAHCRVCVAFIKNSAADVAVTDIRLTPDAPIAAKADMTLAYDWSTTPATVTAQVATTGTSGAALSYDNTAIPAGSDDAVLSATRHYCVPCATNTKGWTVSLTCDGEHKEGTFVNEETWESGKNYIYVFSLTEASPKLVKVITQDEYFDCDDIVPGGEFSDTDMTE